ncbi:hypothetical protein JXA48_05140 [Candidatus Woesearchaeota archaeon]|nr:hypothetical protein [Candidatus Woesearchaeota archaeon]
MNKKTIQNIESKIETWMDNHGLLFLRISLAIVFFWFGILKPLGLSPAADLVYATAFWFSPHTFLLIVGWWEVIIGITLLFRKTLPIGIILLFAQMIGTFLPLVLLPQVVFVKFPFVLSMEGQYIFKNLVLISAGIVVGGTLHYKHKKNRLM